jgi:hypothetical protein
MEVLDHLTLFSLILGIYSLHQFIEVILPKKILQESESSKPGTIVFTSSRAHAAPLTGPINSTVSMRFLSLVELIQPSACATPSRSLRVTLR